MGGRQDLEFVGEINDVSPESLQIQMGGSVLTHLAQTRTTNARTAFQFRLPESAIRSTVEVPDAESLLFDFVPLAANFRSTPPLVERLNDVFDRVFAEDDGSGVTFSRALPARNGQTGPGPHFELHLNFTPQFPRGRSADPQALLEKDAARAAQSKRSPA